MPLRRYQPISRAAQWSNKTRWIDPQTREANDLTSATLTLLLYQDGHQCCYSDYGRWWGNGPWCGYGTPALAAQTQADGSGPFVILPDTPFSTYAAWTFPPAQLANLWPGDALLLIYAAVAGGYPDEIERQTIRVLDGPRGLPLVA